MFRTFVVLLAAALYAPAAEWYPIEKAELERTKPKLDANAAAEVIFWHVRIEDRVQGDELQHLRQNYLRIKIYSEPGREKYSKIEVSYPGRKGSVSYVAGRTIKPDGTIIDMKKDAIFDRDLAKSKGFKLKTKSFALPDVKAGDVIEYQYLETQEDAVTAYEQLYFQRDIPVWEVTYHLKPLMHPAFPYGMRTLPYNCKPRGFTKEANGFYATSQSDMPAHVKESFMPPEDEVRAWMLVYYEEDKKLVPEKFWADYGKQTYNSFKPLTKIGRDVRRKAEEITADAKDAAEKALMIDKFCRTSIKNVSHESSGVTAEQREKMKPNKEPNDTLNQGMGWGSDINYLFIALANAAGLDARMARIPDRGRFFLNKNYPTLYRMNTLSVAVNVDGNWKFYDPSTPYLEPGMLRWREEGVEALVSDPKAGFFVKTQFSGPEKSKAIRRASLELSPEGDLSGLMQMTYSGHLSVNQKEEYDGMTPAEREEEYKKTILNKFPSAEIARVNMADVADPVKPATIAYRFKVPGYATRTGKRILFEPNVFEFGVASPLKDSTRKHAIYMPYAYAEDDEITLKLPEGWQLDNAAPPGDGEFGVGGYKVQILVTSDSKTVVYRRKFDWGREMQLIYPVEAYPQLKKIFDFVTEKDHHVLSLKQSPAGSTGGAANE